MTPEKQKIQAAIDLLQAQRPILGDAVVDEAILALQARLAGSETTPSPGLSGKAELMEGERKLVTIMFADFSNFTSMSEKMDAEDIRTIMNNCFSKLVPIIEQYGGHIDKFIGDEIMALFGAPVAHDNDAEFALRAALDMMNALVDFNVEHQTDLGLHFGINTGFVVTGGVGSTDLRQYSVIGDPVNLAARLEDASVSGEILVGHDTFKLTRSFFDFEERASLSVKGKELPVQLYRLLGLKAAPQSARGIEGMQSEMIGRDEPFQALLSAIENLTHQQGQVIALVAEPGMGKSRMLSEIKKAGNYTHWIEGRGQFFEQNISYGLAKSVLDQALGIPLNAPLRKTGDILLDFLINKSPEKVNELYPYLARMRGIPLDEATNALHRAITPDVMQLRIRQAISELLIMRSDGQPTVLVWEDIHWADDSSLQLIEYLFKVVTNKPLLMLLTLRPKEGLVQHYHPNWVNTYPDYRVIELEPLSEADSILLVENLLRIQDLPEKTRNVLFQKAEGNPFYLEELLRSLLDMGILFWQDGYLNLKHEIDQLKIPNTLQGVIEGRIDRLRTAEKITLQAAAVIGRIFGKEMLEYLIDQEKSGISLNQTLPSLQESELVRHRQYFEYLFKHAVTQDVAYNSLLLARRRELHQFVAEAMERIYPEQTEELSESLAWHYQRAGHSQKAIHYLILAADKSLLKFSYREAEQYYREAIIEMNKTTDTPWETKIKVYENLGEALVVLTRFDEARQAYADAIATIPSDEHILHAKFLRKTGESFVPQRRPDQELAHYDLAIKAMGEEHEPNQSWKEEWLEIQLVRTWSMYWMNRVIEMKEILAEIEDEIERFGSLRQKTFWNGRMTLHFIRTEQHDITRSQLAYVERATALSYQSNDYKLIMYNSVLLGIALFYSNKLEQAEKQMLLAIELSQQVGDLLYEVIALQFLNFIYISNGDVAAVRKYATMMEEKAKGKIPFYLSSVYGFYGWLAWKENNLGETEKNALEALKIHNQALTPNQFMKWPLVAAYITQQRYQDAIPHLKDILLPHQMKPGKAVAEIIQHTINLWEEGKTDTAIHELHKIIPLAQSYRYL